MEVIAFQVHAQVHVGLASNFDSATPGCRVKLIFSAELASVDQ